MHARRPQRIHRQCSADRRINAAGHAQDHTGKPVLVDIVAQAQHAGRIIRFVPFGHRHLRAGGATPAVRAARPVRQRDLFHKRAHLEGQRRIGIEAEGCPVEHQLVLSADLIEIDQRQAGFGHTQRGDIQPLVVLVAPVGRTVGHQQDFRARLGQAFHHIAAPDVLAHRQAEAQAAQGQRAGHGADIEDAFFIKNAVIWQIYLETHAGDAPGIQRHIGVEQLVPLGPRQANEHRWAAVRRFARQIFHRSAARIDEGGFQHQIFRRIARQEQFREHHDIGALPGSRGARGAHLGRIAGDIADSRVQLRKGKGERVAAAVRLACHAS